MLARLLQIRESEKRIVLLLGALSFFVLAATTIMGAASEALFIDGQGAQRLPYVMLLGQVVAIAGFYGYRLLREALPTTILNRAVAGILAAGLVAVWFAIRTGAPAALYALLSLGPLYASVLGAESGRLSAALLDSRSSKRLLPLLGTLGGIGATVGAWVVTSLAADWGLPVMLLLAAGSILVATVPAGAIRESMRPRVTTRVAALGELARNRYVVALLAGAALLIALSSLARYQIGAAAGERYSGAELGAFFGGFAIAVNVASMLFAALATRLVLRTAGAGGSLLVYPGVLTATAVAGIAAPGFATAVAIPFAERLFRQNLHGHATSVVGMPLLLPVRIRMGLVSTGVVKPVAVLVASALILFTVGEQAPAWLNLHWTDLYWPIAVLAVVLFGLMLEVRRRYPVELRNALHARRLQLDELDDEEAGLPLDPAVREQLLGYLASGLEERAALAVELLAGREDAATIEVVRGQWPKWPAWLRLRAVALLEGLDDENRARLAAGLEDGGDDAVRAALLELGGAATAPAELWRLARGASGPRTRARAALLLADKGEREAVARELESWIAASGERPPNEHAAAAARTVARWPDEAFDRAIPELVRHAPEELLAAIAARPRAEFADLCVTWLGSDPAFPFARDALKAIGEPGVPALERAAGDPTRPPASIEVLTQVAGHSAHLATMRLMAHAREDVRSRAVRARLHSGFELSTAERLLTEENLDAVLAACERFDHYARVTDGVERGVAESERGAALEDVLANLNLLQPEAPYRQLWLAEQSPDARQRAYAAELLDELLPSKYRRRVLALAEGMAGGGRLGGRHDRAADRQWLELIERLEQRTAGGARLAALKASALFSGWRVRELELLTGAPATEPDVAVVLRAGEPVDLERTLLQGFAVDRGEGDLVVPLERVYRAVREAPRCGRAWLEGLAARVPEGGDGGGEVTRSAMVSLASRAIAEDQAAANAMALWQRMFFLRSNPLTEGLPPARLRLLAEISRSLTAPAGTTVVHEGRLGNHFYLVCTGRLEVTSGGVKVAELGPSDGFGAMALLRGDRRALTVRALEPCELIAIARTDFLDLLEFHPSLVRSFARMLAAQIVASRAAGRAPA